MAAGLFLVGIVAPNQQPAVATAGTNQTINFQGRLLNAAGAVVADGNYNIEFRVYQDGSGRLAGDIIDGATPAGTKLWTEDYMNSNSTPNPVVVKNGYFSVSLGTYCPVSGAACSGGQTQSNSAVNFNSDTLWLSMNIAGTPNQTSSCAAAFATNCTPDGEMLPMKRMSSAVYAMNANQLQGLSASAFAQVGTTNTFTQANTFSAGGVAVILSGTPATGASLLQVGSALTSGSTNGTLIGANTTSSADLINLQVSNATKFKVDNSGAVTMGGAINGVTVANNALTFSAAGAATIQAASNQNLQLNGNGTGDIVAQTDADSNVQITQVTAAQGSGVDQLAISNAGFGVTTADTNNLSLNFVGGAAAVESSAERINLTPSSTSGSTWNGIRVVQNATGPATGVTTSGVKLEGPTTAGAGTYNGVNIANIGAVTTGGTVRGVNITATNSQTAGTVQGININAITAGTATETALNIGGGWDSALTVNSVNVVNGSGIVQVAAGGTGLGSYTTGDLLVATAATTIGKIAAVGLGSCLISQGLTTAPIWGTCGSGFANTALSNLASVAINTDLQFQSGATRTINIATNGAAVGNQLTVAAGSSGGAFGGGNLMLQGGAKGSAGTAGSVIAKANGSESTTFFQVQNSSGAGILMVDTQNARVGINTGVVAGTLPTADLSFGEGADRTISVVTRNSNAAGRALTIGAGNAGAGALPFAGGTLTLQGGNAAGTGSEDGGNVLLQSGDGTTTGDSGQVILRQGANGLNSTFFEVQKNDHTPVLSVNTNTTGYNGYLYLGGTVTNQSYSLTFSADSVASDRTIGVDDSDATDAAGDGKNLVLHAGSSSVTNANGGSVILTAGNKAAGGAGASGGVKVLNLSDTTTAFQVQNAAATAAVFSVDTNVVPAAALATTSTGATTAPRGMAMQGRYLYVVKNGASGNGLVIYDVSNPASPTVKGTTSLASSAPRQVAVQGKYAYVTEGGTNQLSAVDITNPNAPSIVSNVTVGAAPEGVAVHGRYAYVANSSANTISVVDISNPAAMSVTTTFTITSSTPWGLTIQGDYLYVADQGNDKLQIVDISTPASPSTVGGVTTGATSDPYAVAVQGRYAYVVSNTSNTFKIFDVSTPTAPAQTATLTIAGTPNPTNIVVQGKYAYVTRGSDNFMSIYDVSDPTVTPVLVGSVATGNTPIGIVVQGRYAYVSNVAGNSFSTYDIGGAYSAHLEAGGIETNTLAVNGSSSINGDQSVMGSLVVGQSLQVANGFSMAGDFTMISGTQVLTTSAANSSINLKTNGTQTLNINSSGQIQLGTVNAGGFVTIGDAVAGAELPNEFMVDQYGVNADPTATEGAMYYNAAKGKFRCAQGSSPTWSDCVSSGSATTALDNLASVNINTQLLFGSTVTNAGLAFTGSSASANDITITSQTATAGAGGDVFINGGNTVAAGTNGGVTIDTGSGATTANGTINLGTVNAKNVNVGNATGTNKVTLQGSTLNTTNNNSGVLIGGGFSASDTTLTGLTLDSFATFADPATTCSATVNDGTLYYNSNAASGAVRACVRGTWEDLVSTGGLGLLAFGVVPDSSNAGAIGDLSGSPGGYSNSPCKTYWASTTSVTVAPCIAYSGGRKVVVSSITLSINNATAPNVNLAAAGFANICLDTTTGQPKFFTTSTTENTAAVPTWSQNNPVLCLATVQASSTAGSFAGTNGHIYDIRTFTTTQKTFATINAATALGVAVVQHATLAGLVALPAGAASINVRGVVVAWSGAASSTTANVIIATGGAQWVKATGTSAINSVVQTTNTSGYTQTAAVTATAYANMGVSTRAIDTGCATGTCQYSQFMNPMALR